MAKILDYRFNKELLETPGIPVTNELITLPEFSKNLEEMNSLLEIDGVGLAATQIGWSVNLFVLLINENEEKIEPQAFLNPKILSFSKEKVKMEEGCLSFPGFFLKILRPKSIVWKYQTIDGDTVEVASSNLYARAVQHEIDHLNGQLFIKYASPAQRLKLKKWLKK